MRIGSTQGDLLVVWRGVMTAIQHARLGLIGPVPLRRTGGHTGHHGMACVAAPGVPAGDRGRAVLVRCGSDHSGASRLSANRWHERRQPPEASLRDKGQRESPEATIGSHDPLQMARLHDRGRRGWRDADRGYGTREIPDGLGRPRSSRGTGHRACRSIKISCSLPNS
jgi:hypothetical protein